MSRAPSDNVRRAARALADLSRNGCVSVDHRDELLIASGVPRGSWDRVVRKLEELGVVAVERTFPGECRPSSFVVDVDAAHRIADAPPPAPVTPKQPRSPRAPAQKKARPKYSDRGWVYFAQAGDHFKIGWSSNPHQRLYGLQGTNAAEVVELGTIPGTREDERAVHAAFAAFHVRREWFTASPEALALARAMISHGSPPDPAGSGVASQAHGGESAPNEPRATLRSKTQDTLRDTNNTNGAHASPSESGSDGASGAEEDEASRLERMVVRAFAAAFEAALVRIAPLLGSARHASPTPAEPPSAAPSSASAVAPAAAVASSGPPSCDCGPMAIRPRGLDGARFYGCPEWSPGGGGCGARTIGVEVWARAQRSKVRAAEKEEAKQERREAEREERMHGRPRPADLSTLDAAHIKEAVKRRKARDPRLDPQPGDEVRSGTVARHVRARTKARVTWVTWDVVGMQGETHSAALDQWSRWGQGATVVRLGVSPIVHDVASLLEAVVPDPPSDPPQPSTVDMLTSLDVSPEVARTTI